MMPSRLAGKVSGLLAFALVLLAGPAWAGSGAHGKVSYLEGSATRTAGDQTIPLAVGSEVTAGDHIATGPKSRLELLLEDGSVVRVGPESALDVQKLDFAPESSTLTARFKLALGKMWSHVEKLRPGGSYEVETDQAVAGVRGTEFRVDAQAGTASVEVYKGRVAVAARELRFLGEASGEPGTAIDHPAKTGVREVLVEPGKHLRLDRDGMRLFRQAAARDDFARFVAGRARPSRESLFPGHEGQKPELGPKRERDIRERRELRRERLLRQRPL